MQTAPSYSDSPEKQRCRDDVHDSLLQVIRPEFPDFSNLTMPSTMGVTDPKSLEWGIHGLRALGYRPRIFGIENKRHAEMRRTLRGLDLEETLCVVHSSVAEFLEHELFWCPPFLMAWLDYCSAFDKSKLGDLEKFFRHQREQNSRAFVFAATYNISSRRGAGEDHVLNPKLIAATIIRAAKANGFSIREKDFEYFPYRNIWSPSSMLYIRGIFRKKG